MSEEPGSEVIEWLLMDGAYVDIVERLRDGNCERFYRQRIHGDGSVCNWDPLVG